jgi:drug/metabolite transporter (DMT)-like permease
MQSFMFDRYYLNIVFGFCLCASMLYFAFRKDNKSIIIFTMTKRTPTSRVDRITNVLVALFIFLSTCHTLYKGNIEPKTETITHLLLTIIFLVQLPAVTLLLFQRKPYWSVVAPLLMSMIGLFCLIHYFRI